MRLVIKYHGIIFQSLLFIVFVLFKTECTAQTNVTKTLSSGSGSWTVPYGVTSITVKCWGAGGGGGGSTGNTYYGAGGGSGSYVYQVISVVAGDVFTYSIGTGGTGTTGAGGTGGTTTFSGNGYSLSAGGGGGGGAGAGSNGAAGAAGTASGGSTNTNGNVGGTGSTNAGGAAPNGGAGGTAPGANADGNAGTAPGGGGSGSEYGSPGNRSGGAGGSGRITIDFSYTQNTYTMGTSGSQSATINNNSEDTPDKFYDNGGSGSNYSNSVNATYVFNCAGGSYVRMKITYNGSAGEALKVYDGTSSSDHLTGEGWLTSGGSTYFYCSTSGSLTIVFTSDASTTNTGWSADVWIDNKPGQIWNGSASTSFVTASNWEASVVPGQPTSIYIPSGLSNYPNITGSIYTNSLTIQSGATYTVSSGGMYIYGDLTVDGTYTQTGGIYTFMRGGGSNSAYTNLSGSGDMSTLNMVVGYGATTYLKLLSNVTVNYFDLDNSSGHSSYFDMNTYNFTVSSTTTIDASQYFYQRTGNFSIDYATPSIDNTSFNENTGTTIFTKAGSQTIPAITYYNLSTTGAGTKTFGASTVDVNGAVNIGSSSTLASGNYNATVAGNWVNDGAFTQGTGTVTFDGTSTISGSATTTFYNITITGTLTGVSSGNFNVSRNWDNTSGTYNHNNGTVTFTGTTTLTTGGNSASKKFYNVTLNGTSATLAGNIDIDNVFTLTAGTWDVSASNYSMNVGGNWANSATYTERSGTVTFDGTSTISGSATTSFYDVIISGTLTGKSAANFTVKRNWTNNGTYTHNSGTVTFNGAVAQTIDGSSSTTFYNYTNNNSSTGVSLGANTTVNNTFTLTAGLFKTVSYTLTIGTASANGSVSGGGSTTYIVAYDNAGTIGYVKQFVNSNAAYSYPIGDATNYTPLTFTLTANGGLSSAYVTVYTKDVKVPGLNTSITTYLDRYWNVTESGFTTPTYDISYTYVDADLVGSETGMLPIKKSGTTWYKPTGSSFTSGTAQGTGSFNAGTNTLTWTGLSTFSGFGGVPDGVVTLPIELVSFEGVKDGKNNILTWATSTERDNDFFTIEKTYDGENYEIVGTEDGAGNSNQYLEYSLTDHDVKEVINYYHLKQTDFDGKYTFSNVISIDNRVNTGNKEIVMITNILGQEVNELYRGIVVIVYADGTSKKIIQ